MNYNEILEKVTKISLDFHHVLSQTYTYKTMLSEKEFLQRNHDIIERTTKDIAGNVGDTCITILALPKSLLSRLSDVIYTETWDTEDGGEQLFEQLTKLFRETPFDFAWNFDAIQKSLSFKIDSITWSVPCENLEQEELWICPNTYSNLEPNLNHYLKTQGWELYPVMTWTQVVMFVLLPIEAIETVKDYLISADKTSILEAEIRLDKYWTNLTSLP